MGRLSQKQAGGYLPPDVTNEDILNAWTNHLYRDVEISFKIPERVTATKTQAGAQDHPSAYPVSGYSPCQPDRLVGLVVKASASRAEDPGFESRWRRDFFGVESYQ